MVVIEWFLWLFVVSAWLGVCILSCCFVFDGFVDGFRLRLWLADGLCC